MTKNEKNAHAQDTREQVNPNEDLHNLESDHEVSTLTRRSFLGRAGASTAIAAAVSVGLPSLLLTENAEAQSTDNPYGATSLIRFD
jgi:hypothetical protein